MWWKCKPASSEAKKKALDDWQLLWYKIICECVHVYYTQYLLLMISELKILYYFVYVLVYENIYILYYYFVRYTRILIILYRRVKIFKIFILKTNSNSEETIKNIICIYSRPHLAHHNTVFLFSPTLTLVSHTYIYTVMQWVRGIIVLLYNQ